jgi:hypothetical protein
VFEAILCFKCHSSFYGTLPNAPSNNLPETDTAREFNPNNAGFHPVLASNAGTIGRTNNILSPYANTSLMGCGDCHASNVAGDLNGPHGATTKFILKGANTKWDTSLTLSSPAGAFCWNCHNSSFTNSRFPGHRDSEHNGLQCFGCHSAVPHGGPRPGILVAPAGATAAVGGQIPGYDNAAPYFQGTGRTLYIKSYPSAGQSWSESNCGCNGTSHD